MNCYISHPYLVLNMSAVISLKGKIIRTVLCCVAFCSCAQKYAHGWY